MKIISDFHDYYDSIRSFGIDNAVLYKRTKTDISWKNKDISMPYAEKVTWHGKGIEYEIYKHIVGFCGQLYPVIEFRQNVNGGSRAQFFYNAEDVKTFLLQKKISIKDDFVYLWRENYSVAQKSGPKTFFVTNRWQSLTTLFQQHKTPTFVLSRTSIRNEILTLNPSLQNLQFFKIKDSVSAFQDLYMYISGVLGVSQTPMVKLSDKELAKKKGHDSPYSFRKTPEKSKKGKKNDKKRRIKRGTKRKVRKTL